MHGSSLSSFFIFLLSVVVALFVAVYPLSADLSVYRPELLCLVVIYWVLHSPHQLGVGIAWCLGLLQDLVEDGVWGGHALALALVAYIGLMSYRRLRTYSMTQQTVWIFVFVGIHQLFVNWIQGLHGYAAPARYLVVSALITAGCWPFLILFMGRLQRRYRSF